MFYDPYLLRYWGSKMAKMDQKYLKYEKMKKNEPNSQKDLYFGKFPR